MILLTGSTGFVGRHVASALRAEDRPVRCLVRRRARGAALEQMGCELAEGDMSDADSLARAVDGCDRVIHLVAIIHGSAGDFQRTMTRGTGELIAAAKNADVSRFVLISALGIDQPGAEAIPYYRAKQAMERAVAESGIPSVTLRPSFVFGPDGGALPRFASIARLSPVIPVMGPGTQRIQPLWIGDLAHCAERALDTPPAGGLFELGGPEVLTWNELWQRIARALGKRRPLVHVPFWLARVPAAMLERLPRPPLTRDQLAMLGMGDNVCDPAPAAAAFGLDLLPLDEQLDRSVRAR